MIRLLITGGSGLIGSRFLKLLPQDIKVVANIDRIEGYDLLDLPSLLAKFRQERVDAIVHFAAFTDVTAAFEQTGNKEGICYRLNVLGTKHAIELARHFHAYFIHISTDYIFDGIADHPYIETDSPHPVEWYGQTKLAAEKLVITSGIPFVIARTSYPFVSSFSTKLDLVRNRIVHMKNGTLPSQFTDHIITPTFVDDLARAISLFLQNRPTGIFHTVGSSSLSDFELSGLIQKVFSLPGTIKQSEVAEYNKTSTRPYQPYMAISNNKFTRQFGPIFHSLQDALVILKDQGVDVLS